MLIKAERLISPRWPVSLNYLFVFLFTVSVCLRFFISLWRSVIGACVSFWLEWLPDDPSWWYVDDLLIYGFLNVGIWRHCWEFKLGLAWALQGEGWRAHVSRDGSLCKKQSFSHISTRALSWDRNRKWHLTGNLTHKSSPPTVSWGARVSAA